MSDITRTAMGRRMPFIVVGSIFAPIAMYYLAAPPAWLNLNVHLSQSDGEQPVGGGDGSGGGKADSSSEDVLCSDELALVVRRPQPTTPRRSPACARPTARGWWMAARGCWRSDGSVCVAWRGRGRWHGRHGSVGAVDATHTRCGGSWGGFGHPASQRTEWSHLDPMVTARQALPLTARQTWHHA